MDRDLKALFREVADRPLDEREAYYARHQVPTALRAEVESLRAIVRPRRWLLRHRCLAATRSLKPWPLA